MKTIVFASSNSGKLQEISALLGKRLRILSLAEVELQVKTPAPEVDESADSYRGNAQLKADAIFEWCGLPTLADDSGLEVLALNRRPGLYSARYAGPGSSSEDNINKLLTELKDVSDRRAELVCHLYYRDASDCQISSEGRVFGELLHEKRGNGGFGYDPLFLIPELGLTISEIKELQHDFRTHRGRALADWEKQLLKFETARASAA